MGNVFILGAGFSKPAGLPLGTELFADVVDAAKQRGLYENILKRDVVSFLDYLKRAKGRTVLENEINFEEFVSYLDVEHFLQLKGSDHWSSRGNLSQIAIRNLIALILHKREQAIDDAAFSLYEKFVENLGKDDWIITFNYDTVLERAFRKKSIPYRLFPTRFKNVSFGGGEADNRDEIVLLKMHGSIDWFDISHHDEAQQYLRQHGLYIPSRDGVFGGGKNLPLQKILNGPYPQESPLQNIYQTDKLDVYLDDGKFHSECPLIISPSFSKMVYLNPLTEFWRGFEREGVFTPSVSVIGFSLPEHDEYILQPLFSLITNFQNVDPKVHWVKKTKLKMVDFRPSKKAIAQYKKRYSFIDWNKADCYFGGFSEEAFETLFVKR